jgi:hypothetical protein
MYAPLLQVLALEKVTEWPRTVLQTMILLFLSSPLVTHRTSSDYFLHDALTAFSRYHVRAAHFSPDQYISASVHLTAAEEALNSSVRN